MQSGTWLASLSLTQRSIKRVIGALSPMQWRTVSIAALVSAAVVAELRGEASIPLALAGVWRSHGADGNGERTKVPQGAIGRLKKQIV